MLENSGAMVHGRNGLHARTAQTAAKMLGGHFGLAAYLEVRPAVVLAWTAGTLSVSEHHFLKMVDVVSDELTPIQQRAVAAARRVGKDAADEEAQTLAQKATDSVRL
jgi:hypothetical protein